MKVLVLTCFYFLSFYISAAQGAIYGVPFKEANGEYSVLWTNIPRNFNVQMTGFLNGTNTIWTNLAMIRSNYSYKAFSHPLTNIDCAGYYRLIILP